MVMKQLFEFHKNNKTCFEIKEDYLRMVNMPNIIRGTMSIVEESQQTGYSDPRWIEKSNLIKARDNYTCQLCHTFNPMYGGLIFVQQGEYETCHHYEEDSSRYMIHVKDYNFTINFDFYSGYHLAMPRLNVHHKIYYRNRHLWDYQDDCLVTLCEECHNYIHSRKEISIPIVEENALGQIILIGKTPPKPYQPKLVHTDLGTFHPFALVKENLWGEGLSGQSMIDFKRAKGYNMKWYDYHETLDNNVVNINYKYKINNNGDPRFTNRSTEDIKNVADFIIMDFIEHYLGFRRK